MNTAKRANNSPKTKLHNYEEVVLKVDRVTKVVKGGRRFRFRVLVVIGDGKGKVGLGLAKGTDVTLAKTKAVNQALKHIKNVIVEMPMQTVPHDVMSQVGGAKILIKPAKEGTGLIAGSVTRQILEIAGYNNIYSKSLGNNNKLNLAKAVIAALDDLVAKEDWLLNPKTARQGS